MFGWVLDVKPRGTLFVDARLEKYQPFTLYCPDTSIIVHSQKPKLVSVYIGYNNTTMPKVEICRVHIEMCWSLQYTLASSSYHAYLFSLSFFPPSYDESIITHYRVCRETHWSSNVCRNHPHIPTKRNKSMRQTEQTNQTTRVHARNLSDGLCDMGSQ